MADKRILELSLHTSLTLSDVIPIVSNNETKKTTYGSLYYGIRDGVVSGSSQIDYTQITNVPNNLISGSSQITILGFVSSSITGSSVITASFDTNTRNLTFTKGNSTQFSVNIPDVSGSSLPAGVVSGSSQLTSSYDIIYVNASETSSMAVSSSLYAITASYAVSTSFAVTSSLSETTLRTTVYVKNVSGTQIDKGKVVRISGATGDNPLIVTASFLTEGQSANTLGITTQNIPNDDFGYVITEGVLLGVNTNGMSAGQLLYLGEGGSFTTTPPTAPNHGVRLGEVLRVQQNNGSIYVRVDNGSELGEAHDVVDNSTSASYGDILVKSGSVWTNSKTLNGDYTISGSLFVSGTTEFGGNLVPKFPSGSTLGTLERPFREIFVSSGSINIASDAPGDPNTSLSNVDGNILISAGGVRLVDPASFIAATGSFSYLSGSFTHIGTANRIGDTIITGSLQISGSGYINTHRILTDLDSGSYAITGSNTFSGSQSISGSLYVSGSVYATDEFYINGNKLFNYAQFSDTTTQSGSANTAYSMKFNTTDISHNVSVVSGTRLTVANTGIYNLQFSAQLDNPSNTNEIVDIWIAITGSNVPNSNTRVGINKAQAGNEGKLVAAWNYMIPLSASQYVELKWSSNGGNIILLSEGTAINPTRPAVPSAIATITQIA